MAGPEPEVTSLERTRRDAYMVGNRGPVGQKGSRAQIIKKHTGSAMKHALLIVMPSFDKKWKKKSPKSKRDTAGGQGFWCAC